MLVKINGDMAELEIMPVDVDIKKLHTGARIPVKAHEGDSCYDVYADHDISLHKGCVFLARTGLAMAIPRGWGLSILPRSGLVAVSCIIIPNSPARIDSCYRGEIGILLYKLSGCEENDCVEIKRGERIAQVELGMVIPIRFHEVDELPPTDRGSGGFGSTGR
jgi:dUTP pyrophosphatase